MTLRKMQFQLIARRTAQLAALLSLIALFLWLLQPPFAASIDLKPIPALGFVFAALSLWIWSGSPSTPQRRLTARLLGLVVCVIGALSLWNQVFGNPSERLIYTPVFLILLGGALILLNWTLPGKIYPSEYLALLAAAIGVFSFLYQAFFIGADSSYDLTSLSDTDTLIIFMLAWGIVCASTKGGMIVILRNQTATARALRRLLLVAIITIPIIGWIRLIPERLNWYSTEFGTALLITCSLSVLFISVLILGTRLIKTEVISRKAEHRRLMRENDFRATFEQAAVGLAHVSTTGRFLRTNERLSTLLGYSKEEFSRLTFQDISFPEDLTQDLAYFHRVLMGEISRYQTEKRYIRKDGSLIWVALTAAVLRAPDGKPKYFISVLEDISAWKKAQEEVEAANKAKDRFISIISHELRTPLTPVLAALSGNGSQHPVESIDDPAVLEMMRRNIEHEASIINDLLELTRITSTGKLKLLLQPVDLHSLIKEIVQGIQNALHERELTCELRLTASDYNVNADPIRLRQIFLNLLDNAMKFTPPGGKIVIETRIADSDRIEVEVSDTGIGIAAGSEERIFHPFEQEPYTPATQRRYGGLGLGLAIVRGLVEAHGGTIHVLPSTKGATFVFTLSITKQRAAHRAVAKQAESPKIRILLVEDHNDTRVTLERLLKRRGHTVHSVGGVKEAEERFAEHPFDLLISDIGLPDGSGLDLPAALAFRAEGAPIPCIALSGFGTDEDLQRSLLAGFSRHITKPVEMGMIDSAIADLFGQ